MAERSLKENASEENVRGWCVKCVERFEIELVNHFAMEEQLVFPLHPGALADELIADHRRMEELVGGMRTAPREETLRAFLELLRRHIRREENEYFQEVQLMVEAGQLETMGAEIDRRAVRVCL